MTTQKEILSNIETELGDIRAKLDNHLTHEFLEVKDSIDTLGGMVTQNTQSINENTQGINQILLNTGGLENVRWRGPVAFLTVAIPLIVFLLDCLFKVMT